MGKGKDIPILVNKADKLFRVSPTKFPLEDGSNDERVIEHRVGSKGGVMTIVTAMAKIGTRDDYLKKQVELRKKYKGDSEGFHIEDAMWFKHFKGQTRDAFVAAAEKWVELYNDVDLIPRATWVPTGDKAVGSVFCIWAMVRLSSRRLAIGSDKDYSRYLWSIKKQTQGARDKNEEVTRDGIEYLKMGHASKDVAYFLNQVMHKGEIPQSPPPLLGFGGDNK